MLAPRKLQVVGRRNLIVAAGGMFAAPSIVRAQGQNGVALVIGNSNYKWEASLPNVKRDAPDVAKRFQALGLKTELLENLGRDALRAAIEKFREASRGAKLAVFYFAGHGVSWEKETYVVPVDADLSDPKIVQSLVPVSSIIAAAKDAAHRLLVFDSCRNNPADGWRQKEAKSQARSDAADRVATEGGAANTLVLMSTAPGGVALDGPAGENSPFAASLLRQLDAASVDLQALPGKLRRDLLIATECRQMVWEQNTYSAPFLLAGAGKVMPRPDPPGIVELPNAYAFVRQAGLVLPPGLVGLRPATGSSDAQKIGAFKYETITTTRAVAGQTPVFVNTPGVLVVMSLAGGKSAELVASVKDWGTGSGARWRFATGDVSGNKIVVPSINGSTDIRFVWRDQNSGTHEIAPTASAHAFAGAIGRSFPFTRLDG